MVEERFWRTSEEECVVWWEEEGAERNSTKLDWYFWSRGAMSRWTWGYVRVSEISDGMGLTCLAFQLDFLLVCVGRIPLG